MPNFTLVNFYKNYGGVSEIYICVCVSQFYLRVQPTTKPLIYELGGQSPSVRKAQQHN